MSDARFLCPGCNAELNWTPGQGRLTCPYCGFVKEDSAAPAAQAPAEIKEYRLDQAALQAARGWGVARKSLECSACAAVSDLDPEVTVTTCPFCGSSQVTPHEADQGLIRPESLLPFAIEADKAQRMFRDWLKSLWFRPSALKSTAQIESMAGVYIPAWTFDCRTHSHWQAEAGYDRQERYTETVNGQKVEKTRTVTDWRPASGEHDASYDDWVVQASSGLDQRAIKGLQPFDTKALVPYDTRFLAGFRAERYQVGLEQAWETGRKEIEGDIENACGQKVPGDHHRNLKVQSTFTAVTFKHVLLPVWISAYRYNGQVYRYLVNGQTGKAGGDAPLSWPKIIAFILSILLGLFLLSVCAGYLS